MCYLSYWSSHTWYRPDIMSMIIINVKEKITKYSKSVETLLLVAEKCSIPNTILCSWLYQNTSWTLQSPSLKLYWCRDQDVKVQNILMLCYINRMIWIVHIDPKLNFVWSWNYLLEVGTCKSIKAKTMFLFTRFVISKF